jgi:hypothetical protein
LFALKTDPRLRIWIGMHAPGALTFLGGIIAMTRYFACIVPACFFFSASLVGGEPALQARPVPLTRPEMKRLLEDSKTRTPCIPLPTLTEADKEKLGERGTGYESRLRFHYLPASDPRGGLGFARTPDPKMSLSYEFKTQMFWIVSRANNCLY